MPEVWDDVSYVISSGYRIAVVESLVEADSGPEGSEPPTATPTAIANGVSVSTTHVSRAISELERRSIVTLTVPQETSTDRRYALTTHGKAVWETIERNGLAE